MEIFDTTDEAVRKFRMLVGSTCSHNDEPLSTASFRRWREKLTHKPAMELGSLLKFIETVVDEYDKTSQPIPPSIAMMMAGVLTMAAETVAGNRPMGTALTTILAIFTSLRIDPDVTAINELLNPVTGVHSAAPGPIVIGRGVES